MAIYAGTSGWAYSGWKPKFYPAKLPSKQFLAHYASRLNTVEVNYSFRRLVARNVYEGWCAATPAEFKFAIKAHQRITHIHRLKNAEEFTRAFLSSIAPLYEAGKLGPVLFQLPPNLKADAALLEDFVALLPRTLRYAFEFRHQSWFADAIFDLLRKHEIALCVAEAEKLTVPDVVTAGFAYYRFRQPEYTAQQRREIAEKIGGRRTDVQDVFAYFKHEETPEGALYAEELLREVGSKAA